MLRDDGKFSIKAEGSVLRIGTDILEGTKNLEEKTDTTRVVIFFFILYGSPN